MPKANKTVLSLRATDFRTALKQKGYDVPTSVLMEIFAKEHGFKSFAAYKAVFGEKEQQLLRPAEKTPAPVLALSELTHKIRLVYDSESLTSWRVVPLTAPGYYEVEEASELAELMRTDEVVNYHAEELVDFWAFEPKPGTCQTTRIWVAAPDVNSYGLPPVLDGEQEDLPALAENCDKSMHDLGDDSEGATMVEVLVTEDLYEEIMLAQKRKFMDAAFSLLEEMAAHAKRHGFAYNPASQQHEEFFTSRYPLALPEFYEHFKKQAGI